MEERTAEESSSGTEQSDEEWAESRRLRLLRRRRLIATLALIGLVVLLVLVRLAKIAALLTWFTPGESPPGEWGARHQRTSW